MREAWDRRLMGIGGGQAVGLDGIGDFPFPVKRQGYPLCGPERGGERKADQQAGQRQLREDVEIHGIAMVQLRFDKDPAMLLPVFCATR